MDMNRVQEIMDGMHSFGKDRYRKDELLNEMFSLQQEMVSLTFNDEHASTAGLKIWDVERHLEQLNEDYGHAADEELRKFIEESKTFCNLIKAEVSGSRGENKVFRTLQYLHSDNEVVKNIELKDGSRRTELDAVVITPGAITIVEVKNTAKNIFIDEKGDYYRTGEFLKWDCNIAEKMSFRKELLEKILSENGIEDIPIYEIIVFTDNSIEVHNKCRSLKTCFASQLTYVIDGQKDQQKLSDDEINHIAGVIKEAECQGAYPFDFDVNSYKKDFAVTMAVLEEASGKKEEENSTAEETENFWQALKRFFSSEKVRYAGSAIAGAAIAIMTAAAVSTLKNGGES